MLKRFIKRCAAENYKYKPTNKMWVVFAVGEEEFRCSLSVEDLEKFEFILFEYDRLFRNQVEKNEPNELLANNTVVIKLPLDESQFVHFKNRSPTTPAEFFEFEEAMELVADFLSFGTMDALGLCRNLHIHCLPELDSYEFGLYIAKEMDWIPYGIYKYTASTKGKRFSHICIAFDKGICLYVRPRRIIILKRSHAVAFGFYNNAFWQWGHKEYATHRCCKDETCCSGLGGLGLGHASKCLSVVVSGRFLCGG